MEPGHKRKRGAVCEHGECASRAWYGFDRCSSLYCRKHASDGMWHQFRRLCQHEGCVSSAPCYAMPGERATFCQEHAATGMIDVRNKRCEHEGCTSTCPSFAPPGCRLGQRCGRHKLEGMVDVVHPRCAASWCDRMLHRRGGPCGDLCALCFAHLFPDRPVARNVRTKERAVTEALQARFPGFEWVVDKRVEGGCSGRRPDLACDFGSHVVVVEVDEHRHQGYSCENRRTMELFRDFGSRPICFVRLNPDAYGHTPSCWAHGRDGVLRVKNHRDWSARLKRLCECVADVSSAPPTREVTTTHLFYE
jgi:hypothetical protein